jgi:hypothetical protein
MKIYWLQSDIPALRGLSYAEKTTAINSVRSKVYQHWQVWLPQVLFCIFLVTLVFIRPPFENEKAFLFVGGLSAGYLMSLPINSYLQFYLQQVKDIEKESAVPNLPKEIQ